MLNRIKGKKITPIKLLDKKVAGRPVIVDLGCGDGKQVYKMAEANIENFYIGIEPNFKSLEKISRKASLKPAKGGLENLIFLHGMAENLPEELENYVDEVQVNFPWGSLLEGVINAEKQVMENIIKIAKDGTRLMITTTYDDKFEEKFRKNRDLPELTFEYLKNVLKPKYLELGIKVTEIMELDESEKLKIDSSWGKKILASRDREVFRVIAVIYK